MIASPVVVADILDQVFEYKSDRLKVDRESLSCLYILCYDDKQQTYSPILFACIDIRVDKEEPVTFYHKTFVYVFLWKR